MSVIAENAWSPPAEETAAALEEVRDMVQACMQCGTCTASCPHNEAMDITPRQMWRMVQFGMLDRILESRTYWYCSACYTCTLRCPRGLKLTSAMAALKRLAKLTGAGRKRSAFYRAFMQNVEREGRTREAVLMNYYFLKARDPLLPLGFIPLGLRMLRKGRLHFTGRDRRGGLEALFARAAELEQGWEDRS